MAKTPRAAKRAASRLTPKQSVFVQEYLIDLNATQAAIRAGYSAKTAYSVGQENLKKPEIEKALSDAMAARSKRVGITADDVLRQLVRLGFVDIRKALRWRSGVDRMVPDADGGLSPAVVNEVVLIDSADIDDDTAAAISEVSQTDRGGLKVKMHDKIAALTQVGRHLGMFNDKLALAVTEDLSGLTDAELDAIEAIRNRLAVNGGGAGRKATT